MLIDLKPSRDIYVIFQDDIVFPLSWLCRNGFKHVFAIERQAAGWLCVDPARTDMATIILPATYQSEIMNTFVELNPDTTVLHLEVQRTDKSNYPMPMLQGCVGAIQYLLGTYWPFAFTPSQLYNKLTKKTPSHIRIQKLWVARQEDKEERKMQQGHQKGQGEFLKTKPKS